MRICEKCGWHNEEPRGNNDLWCSQCRDFLGFPAASLHLHERQIVIQLIEDRASVLPGGEARLAVRVRNTGDVVEKVIFTIEGDPSGWTVVEPPEIGLFPNQNGEAEVVFCPPRSWQVRSGLTPFRLVATSESDPTVVDHVEGTVDVGPFVDVNASLSPTHSAGPSGAEHHVVLENAGNQVIDVSVKASQPGHDLLFEISPETLRLEPGATGQARVDVSPGQALYAATDKRCPFTVKAIATGRAPIAIQAVHVQQAPTTAPTLVLSDNRIHAAPGREVSTVVTVRNRGRGGEDYTLELLGPAAAWGRVMPPVIALPSAGEVAAAVAFVPPDDPPAPASEIPFAVRCFSQVDPTRSTVAEGFLTVDAVSEISFEVEPRRVRRRWSSRHVVRVENKGNATAELRPVVADPEHDMSFAVSPGELRMPASSHKTVLFKARTRRPKLLAKPTTRSFEVYLTSADGARITSSDDQTKHAISFQQISVLPRKLTALAVAAVSIGGVAGGALAVLASQMHTMF
jgi:hypothetical protein